MRVRLPKLQRGTCLGQLDLNSIDVALPDGPIQTVKCKNLSLLPSCKQLGRQIWFSSAEDDDDEPVWEMTDTSYGGFIVVNQVRVQALLLNDLLEADLNGYHVTEENHFPLDIHLINEHGDQAYIAMEMVILGDEIKRGFFPHHADPILADKLITLIRQKHQGHRSILCLMVTNTFIDHLFLANQVDSQIASLIKDAKEHGVEIIVKKINVNDDMISIDKPLPFTIYNA